VPAGGGPGGLGYVHRRVRRGRCHAGRGSRRNQPAAAQGGRQQPGQYRQDRPVGPIRPRAGDLTAEHHHLVTQDHDLHLLGRLAAPQEGQPPEEPDRDQVQQADRHEPRSCANPPILPNCSSRTCIEF